jgi:hypothetical protein
LTGTLFPKIKIGIIGNERAMERFTAMLGIDLDTCQCQQLMVYILERYANMRGMFFYTTFEGGIVEIKLRSWQRVRLPEQRLQMQCCVLRRLQWRLAAI